VVSGVTVGPAPFAGELVYQHQPDITLGSDIGKAFSWL
jgi:hypothetical protein